MASQQTVHVANAETMMTHASLIAGGIVVAFADGMRGAVPLQDIDGLDPAQVRAIKLPSVHLLTLESAGVTIELPWDFVRSYCDARYVQSVQGQAKVGRMVLGRRLRSLREQGGLKQEELAGKAGVDRGTVSRIENGEQSPRLETLERIARGLGRPVDDLLG